MVWGCISAKGMGEMHVCEGTIDSEVHFRILERRVAIKVTSLPEMSKVISAGQCQTTSYMGYNTMTL